jgi:hypothetical protein
MTRVTPAGTAKARVAVAVMADEVLTDSQLIALSQGGKAQIVQVILPKDDCTLQEQALQGALAQLKGAPTLVSGIGPGAALAWRWLSDTERRQSQRDLRWLGPEQEGCKDPLPKPPPTATGWWRGTTTLTMKAPVSYATHRAPPPASATTTFTAASAEQRTAQTAGRSDNGGLAIPVVEAGRPGQGHRDPVPLRRWRLA